MNMLEKKKLKSRNQLIAEFFARYRRTYDLNNTPY